MATPVSASLYDRQVGDLPLATGSRAHRWVPVLLFLGLALVFCFTSTRGPVSIDAEAPALEAWHMASTGTPWLEHSPPAAAADNPFVRKVANGHVVADRMAGAVIICLPFYWGAQMLGVEQFSLLPAGFAAGVVTAGTGLLLFLALRRRLGGAWAAATVSLFVLGTPTWAVSADAPWTHTVTQFGLAGAALGASRRSWWTAGMFLGLGILGRPHLALIAAILGLGMSWSERSIRPALQTAVGSIAGVVALLAWNRWMFGAWSLTSTGYQGRAHNVLEPPVDVLENVKGFLIAPDRGVLVWTPVLLVLLPAVFRAWRTLPAWTKWLALGGVVYSAVQLRLNTFGGGDGFYGYRLALELVSCLVALYAFAAPHLRRPGRVAALVVLAAQVGAMYVGSAAKGMVLGAGEVWRDNAFLWGLRAHPDLTLVAFVVAALLAVVAVCWVRRQVGPVTVGAPEYRLQD